ncbi:MAG TPA: NAD-dependent epimerase/dehydratase family protein [Streptosporangiaceae bacterium]
MPWSWLPVPLARSAAGSGRRRVLITGGAGFIGSTLGDALLALGNEVTALDNLSTGTLANLDHALRHPSFTFIEGDIRNARLVERVVAGYDAVVHLAARIGLRLVIESPTETIESNVRGTEVVLKAAARHGTRTIVASTSEVYGLSTHHPSSESDPITFGSPTRGRWSYACSKACNESLALALQRERGLPATVVRLFNTVGPRQSARYGMVLSRFVRQALSGEPLTVYGDGTQTRSFCHVSDVLDALTTLIDRPVGVGDVFNIGNPAEITVLDLARTVIARTGSASGITFVPFADVFGDGFEEIERRVPDITKARAELGFSPSRTLESVIDEIARAVSGVPRREAALSLAMAGHHDV